ncbi:MAG: alpha/beta fold hydrolase, partial [Acidobacteria bacterium]|nr:alpha/beta fold hydrolase [Acidobacteriota bacterium]
EFRAGRLDAPKNLDEYMALEDRLFAELHQKGYRKLPDPSKGFDRFVTKSPSDPDRRAITWNRTRFTVPPHHHGAVLLLHGLSDSPYSLRSVGEVYLRHGFAVIWLRLPGHGTVPSALTRTTWKDWTAATQLGLAKAAKLAGDGPLHVAGYSNGGLLALDAAMAAIREGRRVPDRIVLLSPSIGIPSVARLAKWVKLIDWLPPFRKAQWQEVHQEIDPHKYSSFPFNASYQCWKGTREVHQLLLGLRRSGRLLKMPPVLAFQSVTDSTVIATAVKDRLFDLLPANGSELVLFDVNRKRSLLRFFSPKIVSLSRWGLGEGHRSYAVDLVTNASPDAMEVVERIQGPGGATTVVRETGLSWPPHVYSLSHVALPFPPDDPIYGDGAGPDADQALPLGSLDLKGESGQLQIPQSILYRLRYNPFFAIVRRHLEAILPAGERAPESGEAR